MKGIKREIHLALTTQGKMVRGSSRWRNRDTVGPAGFFHDKTLDARPK